MPVIHTKGLAKLRKAIIDTVEEASRASAAVLAVEMSRLLDQPGSGRVWPSKRPGGGPHTASAPGQPPARDTGGLQESIHLVQEGRKTRVAVGHPAAMALEYGRRDGSILPRPYIRPARKNVKKQMNKAARDALRRGAPKGVF